MSINDYFVNVAKEIGNSSNEYKHAVSDHPSIYEQLTNQIENFSFTPVSSEIVEKVISNLNIKKATGIDNISAKTIKARVPTFSSAISNLTHHENISI